MKYKNREAIIAASAAIAELQSAVDLLVQRRNATARFKLTVARTQVNLALNELEDQNPKTPPTR